MAGKIIARMLRDYEVKYVFGIPGGQTLSIYDGIREIEPELRHVLVRDEKCAAYMAHAYAQATGRPGVCDATVGPGAVNLVAGVAEAYHGATPMIVITSDVETPIRGRLGIQECPQLEMLRPFVKGSFYLDRVEKTPSMVNAAFRLAVTGRPAPVHLDLPEDVITSEFQGEYRIDATYSSCPGRRLVPEAQLVKEAVDLLLGSERPVMIAGGGVIFSQAMDEVVELAELLSLPVATTISGKGSIPEDHPLSLGVCGHFFRPMANRFVKEADLALLVGTQGAHFETGRWNYPPLDTRVIHIDVDPHVIGLNYPKTLGIVGDCKLTLRMMIDMVKERLKRPKPKDALVQEIRRSYEEWLASQEGIFKGDSRPVKPQRILKELQDIAPEDTFWVSDTSSPGAWTAVYLNLKRKGRGYVTARGLAGIGYGFPAAIGAKLAVGARPVFCIAGDGGFGMTLNELETARRLNLPILTVVMNDNCLGLIKRDYDVRYGSRYLSTDFAELDYGRIAEAYGCYGAKVESASELREALVKAFKADMPAVVDVSIDFSEIPPIIKYVEGYRRLGRIS